jgi:hypothetical protein
MADIDIVPKHRSYTWLWIVLAIVIVAIVWWALSSGHNANRVGAIEHLPAFVGSLTGTTA